MVKVYLSRKGVPFSDYNVSTDRDALTRLVEMGFRTTPLTVIGEQKIIGYKPSDIDSALEAAGVSSA